MICNKCGAFIDEGATVCSICGSQIENGGQQESASSPAPSKSNSKKIILAVVAAIVAVAVFATVIILAFSGLFLGGPLAKVMKAASKDVEAGLNVDFKIVSKLHGKDDNTDSLSFQLVPFQNEEDKTSFEFGMKDQTTIVYSNDKYYLSNVKHDNYETGSLSKADNEQFKILAADLAEIVAKNDLKGLAEYLNCSIGYKAFDENKFVKRAKRILKDISDKDYLEENFGYSQSKKNGKTTISFDVDVMDAYELLYDIIKESKDVFIYEYDHEQILKVIDESIDDLKKEKYDIRFEIDIVIEDGYIVNAEGELFYANNSPIDDQRRSYTYSFEAEINDIGEAEIDSEVIEQFNKRKEKLGDRDEIYWDAAGHYYFEHYKRVYIDWKPVNP